VRLSVFECRQLEASGDKTGEARVGGVDASAGKAAALAAGLVSMFLTRRYVDRR